MTPEDFPTRLKRFGYYLEQAVHDANHEGVGHDIVHFWDNDCLYLPTFGFTELNLRSYYAPRVEFEGARGRGAHPYSKDSRTQEDLLTQALFSAGYLGPISILPPHRVEYFATVTRRAKKAEEKSYRERLENFIDERSGELSSFDKAAHLLTQYAKSGVREDSSRAVELLRGVEPWTFVLMEATANTWTARLRRLLDHHERLIDLSVKDLPSSEEVLGSPHYENIHRGVSRYRDSRRKVPTIIDAAALTSLVILVSKSVELRYGLFPRFYTSSMSLRRFYRTERWFRDLLRFPIPKDSNRVRSGTVWREPYYYQLRARFPSLRPSGSKGGREMGLSLADLELVSEEVNRAIVRGSDEAERFIMRYELADARPLIGVIESLESLGMADVWMGRVPGDYVDYWTDGLRAIRKLASLDSTQETLAREFGETADNARVHFEVYAAELEVIQAIVRAFDLARRSQFFNDPVSAIKNLGLERWGVSFPAEQLEGLKSRTGDEYAAFILRHADFQSQSMNSAELEIVVGVLLGIDEFGLAKRLLALFERVDTIALRVMRLAAEVRGTAFLPDERLNELFADLGELWRNGIGYSEDVRDRVCVGVGYVAFHIWQKSSAAMRLGLPEDPIGAAAFAVRVVATRLGRLERDALALGTNHVVYVESVAGLESKDQHALVASLRAQARATGHYRFYDTLGWREYLRVFRREIAESNDPCAALHRARQDLSMACDSVYRDREVEDHLYTVVEAFRAYCGEEGSQVE